MPKAPLVAPSQGVGITYRQMSTSQGRYQRGRWLHSADMRRPNNIGQHNIRILSNPGAPARGMWLQIYLYAHPWALEARDWSGCVTHKKGKYSGKREHHPAERRTRLAAWHTQKQGMQDYRAPDSQSAGLDANSLPAISGIGVDKVSECAEHGHHRAAGMSRTRYPPAK